MKKNSIFRSLPFKLLVGVIAGVLVGLLLSSTDGNAFSRAILNIVVTLKYILNQIINFCIPLIIIAFIAPSITQMGKNASKLLLIAVTIAYTSSVGAAFFSTAVSYTHLDVYKRQAYNCIEITYESSFVLASFFSLLSASELCIISMHSLITSQLSSYTSSGIILILLISLNFSSASLLLYSAGVSSLNIARNFSISL